MTVPHADGRRDSFIPAEGEEGVIAPDSGRAVALCQGQFGELVIYGACKLGFETVSNQEARRGPTICVRDGERVLRT